MSRTPKRHSTFARGATALCALVATTCAAPTPSSTSAASWIGGSYQATAILEIVPPRSGEFDERYITTQFEKLSLPETLQATIADSDLTSREDFAGMTLEQVFSSIEGNVAVTPRRSSYLVEIVVGGDNPAILDDLANALVDRVRAQVKHDLDGEFSQHKAELEEEIAQANTRIRLAEVDIRSRLETQNFTVTTFEAEYQRIQNTRLRFSEMRDGEQAHLIADEPTYKQFSNTLDDPEARAEQLKSHPLLADDPHAKELLRELLSATRELARARQDSEKGPAHADTQALEQRVETLKADLDAHLGSLMRSFLVRFELRRENLVRYSDEIDRATADLRRAVTVKAMVDERMREIERRKESRALAIAALEQLNQRLASHAVPIRIVQRASEPTDRR